MEPGESVEAQVLKDWEENITGRRKEGKRPPSTSASSTIMPRAVMLISILKLPCRDRRQAI